MADRRYTQKRTMPKDSTGRRESAGTFERVESVRDVNTDEWTQINQVHYDHDDDEELVTTLAFAIADAKDVDPLDYAEMPPLYESVNTKSLAETFFGHHGSGNRRGETGVVTFEYTGYRVTLRADGWIFVYEPQ